ncbi:YIP1 family protein [Yoonia sp. R2331]|uniref:YIP1 family protein n=1 Tax=Yoonia sp. R2331 TaxID=3237238 RepID=UPI0034E3D87A
MNAVLQFIGRSFVDPKGVATMLNALRLNRGILWSMMALVVCLSVLMMVGTLSIFPAPSQSQLMVLPPFGLAILLGSILVAMVFAFYFTGQMLGGTGRFPGALLLLTWWQAMGVAVQVIQLLTVLILPFMVQVVSIAGFAYLTIALVLAVDVLHGFANIGKAIATIMIAFLGTAFGLALILSLVGVTAQGLAL